MATVTLLEDYAGKPKGSTIDIDSMVASSMVRRGKATYDSGLPKPEGGEEIVKPKKTTKKK